MLSEATVAPEWPAAPAAPTARPLLAALQMELIPPLQVETIPELQLELIPALHLERQAELLVIAVTPVPMAALAPMALTQALLQ